MAEKQRDNLKFCAIHEAGHALIAWHSGLVLHRVSIRQDPYYQKLGFSGFCETSFCEPPNSNSSHYRMFTEQRVLELMAGRAATDLFCPDIPHCNSHGGDFHEIGHLKSSSDIFLSMHNWRIENPAADIEAFYQCFKKPIIKIMKSRHGKRAMNSLAKELIKNGQLSGQEAARILELNWGKPLPLYALPASQHLILVGQTTANSFNDLLLNINAYLSLLQKEILPFCDSEENTAFQNKIIDRISALLCEIKICAMHPIGENNSARK